MAADCLSKRVNTVSRTNLAKPKTSCCKAFELCVPAVDTVTQEQWTPSPAEWTGASRSGAPMESALGKSCGALILGETHYESTNESYLRHTSQLTLPCVPIQAPALSQIETATTFLPSRARNMDQWSDVPCMSHKSHPRQISGLKKSLIRDKFLHC